MAPTSRWTEYRPRWKLVQATVTIINSRYSPTSITLFSLFLVYLKLYNEREDVYKYTEKLNIQKYEKNHWYRVECFWLFC